MTYVEVLTHTQKRQACTRATPLQICSHRGQCQISSQVPLTTNETHRYPGFQVAFLNVAEIERGFPFRQVQRPRHPNKNSQFYAIF
jgi:hypothetical protein